MATRMLGPVRCAHRWTEGRLLPYPQVPTVAPSEVEDSDIRMEVSVCRRCGGARLRMYVSDYRYSGWGYADSLAEIILGRELDEREAKKVRQDLVLN